MSIRETIYYHKEKRQSKTDNKLDINLSALAIHTQQPYCAKRNDSQRTRKTALTRDESK